MGSEEVRKVTAGKQIPPPEADKSPKQKLSLHISLVTDEKCTVALARERQFCQLLMFILNSRTCILAH